MKRFLAFALMIGVSSFGLVGCEEKTEVKKVEETKTPGGTIKETDSKKIEKTGDAKTNTDAPKP